MNTISLETAQNFSGQEILDVYNQYSSKWRKAKFQSKEAGIEALIKIGAISQDNKPKAKPKPDLKVVKTEAKVPQEEVSNVLAALKAIQKRIESSRSEPANPDRPQGVTDAHRDHWGKKIKLLVSHNPRRPTSLLYVYFEAMRGSKTVGDYLSKFVTVEDKKKASQALSNTLKDGFVELS
jgi:hypothetical protein